MAENIKLRHCGTMEVYNKLVEAFPAFRKAQADIENEVTTLLESKRFFRLSTPIIIDVVVHVLHHAEEENIAEAQIISQLEVLNKDFRSINEDVNLVPEVWKPLVADTSIEFRFAAKDSAGLETAGITRTSTGVQTFGTDNAMKATASGGIDPWPTDRFLNIWVCNLGESLLGYAQFPGGPLETDGVVIDYRAFGTTGTARAPFNFGRTTTHEIGHYLNLSHIFGDGRGNSCLDTDYVDDTPNQLGPNYQKPTFPSVSCNNGPDGDMFMNYMDYVDDDSMFMFTEGQAARMNATLFGPRSSLIQQSS
jgi:hypothetical protein